MQGTRWDNVVEMGQAHFVALQKLADELGYIVAKKIVKDQLYNNDIMSCCNLLHCMHIVTYEMTVNDITILYEFDTYFLHNRKLDSTLVNKEKLQHRFSFVNHHCINDYCMTLIAIQNMSSILFSRIMPLLKVFKTTIEMLLGF